jgi:hypothetical protein
MLPRRYETGRTAAELTSATTVVCRRFPPRNRLVRPALDVDEMQSKNAVNNGSADEMSLRLRLAEIAPLSCRHDIIRVRNTGCLKRMTAKAERLRRETR